MRAGERKPFAFLSSLAQSFGKKWLLLRLLWAVSIYGFMKAYKINQRKSTSKRFLKRTVTANLNQGCINTILTISASIIESDLGGLIGLPSKSSGSGLGSKDASVSLASSSDLAAEN